MSVGHLKLGMFLFAECHFGQIGQLKKKYKYFLHENFMDLYIKSSFIQFEGKTKGGHVAT